MLAKLWKESRSQNARRSAFSLQFIERFRKDTSSSILVYTALVLAVLLGVAGLSVDVGSWYTNKRVAQASADAGAVAARLDVMRSMTAGETNVIYSVLHQVASTSAGENGYDASRGDTIEVNNPPTSGAYAGSNDYAGVITRHPARVFLAAALFYKAVLRSGHGGGALRGDGGHEQRLYLCVQCPSGKKFTRLNRS